MPSLESYRQYMLSCGKTAGENKTYQSNQIMAMTWDNDPDAKLCYIYDAFHDDEPEKLYGMSPHKSKVKIPVKCKVHKYSENSDDKDQVSYHLQFMPDYENIVPYYEHDYTNVYGSRFPIGLYIDIPNSRGQYQRWLINDFADIYSNAFDKYNILPCNFRFRWIEETGNARYKRRVWGVDKLRNSYNSGIWAEYRSSKPENQDNFIIPLNPITEYLYYNQRLVISAPIRKQNPLVWEVSKIENINPSGIIKVTVFQNLWNGETDWIDPDNCFEMYADFNKSSVLPKDEKSPEVSHGYSEITTPGKTSTIKVGGGYRKYTALFYTPQNTPDEDVQAVWSFMVDDKELSDGIEVLYENNTVKVKVIDENLIGETMNIEVCDRNGERISTFSSEIAYL